MYNIRFLLLILSLLSSSRSFAQQPSLAWEEANLSTHATGRALVNRQASFTAHLLTGKVDPEKERACNALGMGRKVSLPSPTQPLIRSPWP